MSSAEDDPTIEFHKQLMSSAEDDPTIELHKQLEPFCRGKREGDLKDHLDVAARVYKIKPCREWAMVYLLYLTCHLDAHKIDSAPLTDILGALVELERGNVNPLLKCSINNRPKETLGRRHLKQTAVTAMELLIETGLSRTQAARQVAAVLSEQKSVIQTKRSEIQPHTTVVGWYKRDDRGQYSKQLYRYLFAKLSPTQQMGKRNSILAALPLVLQESLSPRS